MTALRSFSALSGIALMLLAGMAVFAAISFLLPETTFGGGYEICDNQIDDDFDTLADCSDAVDCALAYNCEEICDNKEDDDGDGAVDCDDLYCLWLEPACW